MAWRKTHAVVHLPFGTGGNQESGGLIIIALPQGSAHLALHPALLRNGLGWDNEEKHQISSISRSIAGKAVVAPRHDKHPPTQERSISVKSLVTSVRAMDRLSSVMTSTSAVLTFEQTRCAYARAKTALKDRSPQPILHDGVLSQISIASSRRGSAVNAPACEDSMFNMHSKSLATKLIAVTGSTIAAVLLEAAIFRFIPPGGELG